MGLNLTVILEEVEGVDTMGFDQIILIASLMLLTGCAVVVIMLVARNARVLDRIVDMLTVYGHDAVRIEHYAKRLESFREDDKISRENYIKDMGSAQEDLYSYVSAEIIKVFREQFAPPTQYTPKRKNIEI